MTFGRSSGYKREMVDVLLSAAAAYGLEVDAVVCASDVPAGRPYPWMLYRLAMELDFYPMTAVVKIGDTVADVEEGLNAGAWSVGVALTGNEVGLPEAELKGLEPAEYERLRQAAYQRLARAGAHYAVDSLTDAVALLDEWK